MYHLSHAVRLITANYSDPARRYTIVCRAIRRRNRDERKEYLRPRRRIASITEKGGASGVVWLDCANSSHAPDAQLCAIELRLEGRPFRRSNPKRQVDTRYRNALLRRRMSGELFRPFARSSPHTGRATGTRQYTGRSVMTDRTMESKLEIRRRPDAECQAFSLRASTSACARKPTQIVRGMLPRLVQLTSLHAVRSSLPEKI